MKRYILFFILVSCFSYGIIMPDRGKDGENIIQISAFANAQKFRFRGLGISKSISGSMTSNIDYVLPEDRYLNGIQIFVRNICFLDTATFQVVHPTAGVLDEFGTDWNLDDTMQDQRPIAIPYPAAVVAGLILRLKYKATCPADVDIKINYFLHKKDL